MEVIFSVFKIVSSFLIDRSFEASLVNHLFSVGLIKKLLLIKEYLN